MPKWQIKISKDNPKEAFYPGETLKGNLLVDLDTPKRYTKISVQFNGRSHVEWSVKRGKRTVKLTSTDLYINEVVDVWNSEQNEEGQLLEGEQSWPFSFKIPPRAASYFEDALYGNIRYSLVGKVSNGNSTGTVAEIQIAVLQLAEITDPRLFQPVRQEIQRRVCCLCCASGPIVLTVALPKIGFLLGESIQLHASLENGSNRRLTMIGKLKQKVTFHAGGGTRERWKTFVKVPSGVVGRRATEDWEPTIEIPTANVAIIHGSTCNNIKVVHYVKVTCRIPLTFNISVVIPLQLGNCIQGRD